MIIDFKKTQKELYHSPKHSVVDVPKMTFAVANGVGDPKSADFQTAVETLYALSYSIKMNNKAVMEYVVPPLEGLWWAGCGTSDKSKYLWSIMLRQPDFVTDEIFERAKAAVAKKKPHLDLSLAALEQYEEGLCAQVMHVGSYDDEPPTVAGLEQFAKSQGYEFDVENKIHAMSRCHHEIYLNEPRKVAVDKLKTIIRYPIRNAGAV